MHQDRDFISGIVFEPSDAPPDHLGLIHDLTIPDPIERMLEDLAREHNLDRQDPKVASTFNTISTLKREHPKNAVTNALAHKHLQNLLHGR